MTHGTQLAGLTILMGLCLSANPAPAADAPHPAAVTLDLRAAPPPPPWHAFRTPPACASRSPPIS